MFRFMIIFYALLLTAANVRAQCVRPVVGQNRVLSEDNDEQTFPDQSIVRFKCSTGYVTARASASRSITCTGTQWSNLELRCKILKCLPPSRIQSGTFAPEEESYDYGDVVTYSCKRGLDLIGSSEISCSGDGTFKPDPPRCLVITCLEPPTITKGDFSPQKELYAYGERVTYYCVEGFKLYGSPTISCSDDETFGTSFPECREIFCDPPYIRNAVIDETSRSPAYRYGTSIKISCNKGYRMEGSEYLTCVDGWTALPRCVAFPSPPSFHNSTLFTGSLLANNTCVITCLEPPTITNGQFIPPKVLYKYGETVTYNCVEGFKLYGSPTISCSDNGMFETFRPECREIFCDPPSIQNAVIDETSRAWAYRYQTSIKIRCNKGYRLEGSEYMTCGNDGWTPALPRCVKLSCDAPKIDYAVIQEIDSDATSIRVKCKTGYRINGSDYLTCEENGWNSSLPKCNKVTCDAPNINNAVIVNGQAPYRAEMSIQYQCNKGYNMEGSGNLTCEENGWNPDPPQCKIVTCPKPLEIINGEFNPVKEEYEYGQTIIHFCKKGFRLEGDSAVSCTDDGTFHFPASLKCVEVKCGAPKMNNSIIVEGNKPYKYNVSIKYQCNIGYIAEESELLTCQENGWNPPSQKCKKVTCDEPQFDHAFIIEGKSPPYKYKSSIRVKCENGYTMDEEFEFLTCEENDLEKAYYRVPREELWNCMRKSSVAKKYVRLVQDMYEDSVIAVKCAVGMTDWIKVEVGLHQGSALRPFLFAVVMDTLTDEVRQGSSWTIMVADNIVICGESREQVEKSLKRWRYMLERRGMKVSRSNTEYMCVNEREGSGVVRLQGEEVVKVDEFRNLGSTVQRGGAGGSRVEDVEVFVGSDKNGQDYVLIGTAHVGRFGDKVREVRLRWLGHVQRRDMGYIGRRMLRMEPPGRRKRGRPKRRSMNVVREDMQVVGLKEADVEDRGTELSMFIVQCSFVTDPFLIYIYIRYMDKSLDT
ncbi:sushi, von Willebrand factor type A, EGF and pentraxin domain-containing protein 1 isoform X4 [Silurus meridionalis]|nr:sushi, von Willebrand factor type A, EGF and pentraxin domain-containing protein 1 isoform X4 [Silurus meridionalis]